MNAYILAIDQGTTNTKALLVNRAGSVVARGSVQTPVSYPQPGWVQQAPEDIWQATLRAIAECLDIVKDPAPRIAAIGISNQRETALLWSRRTGQPSGPAVVWQCRRSAAICRQLKAAGHEPLIRTRTGLQVDPMFSGSKIRWLLDSVTHDTPHVATDELCAGNVDAWLLWNLTGGDRSGKQPNHATDATNASRTQLMNLETLDWDDEILQVFGIPRAILPTVRPSSSIFGETVPLELPNGRRLPGGIPIASMIGDSHASLYGLGGFRPGSIKATYGTGSSLMTPTEHVTRSDHGLSTTVAWALSNTDTPARQYSTHQNSRGQQSLPDPVWKHHTLAPTYALEGNIYATGGAVKFIGDILGLRNPAPDIEAMAQTVENAGGVVFVPALVGLGAPHWQDQAQGLIHGLTLGTGRPHIARAALEAIAFQVRDVFDVMQTEAGIPLQTLLADGGASQNALLMQFQADILNCAVERSRSSEVSPLGAAFLAGLAVGFWKDEIEISELIPARDRFEPHMGAADRDRVYERWQAAVERAVLERSAT